MMRVGRLLLAASLLAASALPASAGVGVALRAAPVSHGAYILLGDLFEGAGAAAATPVAEAPGAGMQAVLEAGRVQTIARRAGLDWANPAGQRRVIVTAPNGRVGSQIGVQVGAQVDIGAPRGFDRAPFATATSAPLADAATRAAPRRQRVIKRDDLVQVAFEDGGISLSVQARALGDAAVGETLQLTNTQSKKLVEAVASGPGHAVVGPAAEALKAQALDAELHFAAR